MATDDCLNKFYLEILMNSLKLVRLSRALFAQKYHDRNTSLFITSGNLGWMKWMNKHTGRFILRYDDISYNARLLQDR